MESESEIFSNQSEEVDRNESALEDNSAQHHSISVDLDYAELDPELYGLRRSGRGNMKHFLKVCDFYARKSQRTDLII